MPGSSYISFTGLRVVVHMKVLHVGVALQFLVALNVVVVVILQCISIMEVACSVHESLVGRLVGISLVIVAVHDGANNFYTVGPA